MGCNYSTWFHETNYTVLEAVNNIRNKSNGLYLKELLAFRENNNLDRYYNWIIDMEECSITNTQPEWEFNQTETCLDTSAGNFWFRHYNTEMNDNGPI